MTTEGRKHLPPYVSYRTFRNFVERLALPLPSRIDRSYWGDQLSGSTGIQLMAALRFLNLIDANGKPTEKMKPLVATRGEQRNQLLREVLRDAFSFVLKSSLELERATYSELDEVFHNTYHLTDDVSRKCVKFFIAMAIDANLPISPFITKRTRTSRSIPGHKTTTKKSGTKTTGNSEIPQVLDEIPNYHSWNSLLLAKFPNFDPSWNDDLKSKWFAAFDELLRRSTKVASME